AIRDGGGDLGDIAHLASEVTGHEIDVVGEVLPCAADAGHLCLTAELAFRANFASDARDFAGEGVELIDHRVDGVLELEDLAFHVDGDLAGKIAAGYGGGHLGNVADLGCKVSGHGIDGVGEVL